MYVISGYQLKCGLGSFLWAFGSYYISHDAVWVSSGVAGRLEFLRTFGGLDFLHMKRQFGNMISVMKI